MSAEYGTRNPPAPLPLFALSDPPRSTARQRTRWGTQDEAFQSAYAGNAKIVLEYMTRSPSTCDEAEIALGMTHQSCSATINKLMNEGLLIADGTRITRSGRPARVWRVRQEDKT
jgi:predicted ArsR family transcriptional regulator